MYSRTPEKFKGSEISQGRNVSPMVSFSDSINTGPSNFRGNPSFNTDRINRTDILQQRSDLKTMSLRKNQIIRSPMRKAPIDLSGFNTKVDDLNAEEKDFYSNLMEHYELMLLDFKTLDLIDELLPDGADGKSKAELTREKVRNFEGVNALFKRMTETRMQEQRVEEVKLQLDRQFDDLYADQTKTLEDNMIKHVDDDRNQLSYIYEHHTKSLMEDIDKITNSMPTFLRNVKHEHAQLENQISQLMNETKISSTRSNTSTHPDVAHNLKREIQDIRLFHYDSAIN